ncbi:MAG TPA: MGMT family protein [Ktedonobacterales bacterium]|nr:MGMT family protein [Ktedonobacterales bacterium]
MGATSDKPEPLFLFPPDATHTSPASASEPVSAAPILPSADRQITRDEAALIAARVYALVRACPSGRVTTYGWLGAALGYPRGARMVGWIMNESPRWLDVPAQRVVSAKGELTGSWAFGQRGRMKQLLADEGVTFDDAGRVEMKKYSWDPTRDLDAATRERIIAEADPKTVEVSDTLMRLLLDDPASPFRITPAP